MYSQASRGFPCLGDLGSSGHSAGFGGNGGAASSGGGGGDAGGSEGGLGGAGDGERGGDVRDRFESGPSVVGIASFFAPFSPPSACGRRRLPLPTCSAAPDFKLRLGLAEAAAGASASMVPPAAEGTDAASSLSRSLACSCCSSRCFSIAAAFSVSDFSRSFSCAKAMHRIIISSAAVIGLAAGGSTGASGAMLADARSAGFGASPSTSFSWGLASASAALSALSPSPTSGSAAVASPEPTSSSNARKASSISACNNGFREITPLPAPPTAVRGSGGGGLSALPCNGLACASTASAGFWPCAAPCAAEGCSRTGGALGSLAERAAAVAVGGAGWSERPAISARGADDWAAGADGTPGAGEGATRLPRTAGVVGFAPGAAIAMALAAGTAPTGATAAAEADEAPGVACGGIGMGAAADPTESGAANVAAVAVGGKTGGLFVVAGTTSGVTVGAAHRIPGGAT
mmetsp:Transcript_37945/g.104315  ORF Transcript_37945/g.104315 Transcript_37945/m.104315 type:complete len:461 (+) Transcript_37945:164-1546(+)